MQNRYVHSQKIEKTNICKVFWSEVKWVIDDHLNNQVCVKAVAMCLLLPISKNHVVNVFDACPYVHYWPQSCFPCHHMPTSCWDGTPHIHHMWAPWERAHRKSIPGNQGNQYLYPAHPYVIIQIHEYMALLIINSSRIKDILSVNALGNLYLQNQGCR